ncbi:MAG TPA: M55 family metallopeptidase, partial [Clostridia bacterium]|nr:M55 family metallopeptidase [Clostridia bacterium]
DCHGGANTVLWDQLSPLADAYIVGNTGQERVARIEECDGVLLLGYHAMAGTDGAFLNHTWSGEAIQNVYLNGRRSGEIAIDAAIAGDYGKPVIMLSGDDKLCAEAHEFLPWAVTAEVKCGITSTGGILLPQAKAHALLRARAAEAVQKLDAMRPYILEKPVRMRIERTQHNQLPLAASKPYMTIIDGHTYEVTGQSMRGALPHVAGRAPPVPSSFRKARSILGTL